MKNKVVIIDDHLMFSSGLALILKERAAEYEVVSQVYNSAKALQICQKLRPDLVLIDYNMPDKTGLEVLAELLDISSIGNMKFVIISMYAEKRLINKFKKAGAHAYINKTTDSDELFETLEKVMKGQKVFKEKNSKTHTKRDDNFNQKFKLTKRELEILKHLKKGETTDIIAQKLHLSPYTVATHRNNVNQKLGFETKMEFFEFLNKNEF